MRGVALFPFGRGRPRWDPGEAASPPEPHTPGAGPGRLCATHRAQLKPRKPLRSAAPKPRRKGVAPSAITPLLSEGQRGGQTPFPPRHRTPLRSAPPRRRCLPSTWAPLAAPARAPLPPPPLPWSCELRRAAPRRARPAYPAAVAARPQSPPAAPMAPHGPGLSAQRAAAGAAEGGGTARWAAPSW